MGLSTRVWAPVSAATAWAVSGETSSSVKMVVVPVDSTTFLTSASSAGLGSDSGSTPEIEAWVRL